MKYNSNESGILTSTLSNGSTFWNYYEGKDLGEIWGYEYDGFYTVDDFTDTSSWKLKEGVPSIDGYNPRPGDVKFKNLKDDDRGTNMISSGDNTVSNPGDRKYNPQIQISAESETKRSIFREKDKTKRSKKESAQHSKSRNKSFVMTSVSAL